MIELLKALLVMGTISGIMYYFMIGSYTAKARSARKILADIIATDEDREFCKHASRAITGWGQTDSDHQLCLIERMDKMIGDDPVLIKAYEEDIVAFVKIMGDK